MSYSIRRKLTEHEKNNLGVNSEILAHLLFHRGIVDKETAERFITPDYDRDSHDPFLLKDAEKSAERILKAINDNERIAIYSDYDADGIPGAALWHDFFSRIGYENFTIYIPHRHDEGFGVNAEAVDELYKDGVKLMVTLDCGISDYDPIAKASGLGMDVIVTDHHEPPEILPPAFAIVDHKQIDCAYPDKNICGTGVAYKLILAIIKKGNGSKMIEKMKDGHEKWLLDLVGIATMSDMVPLVGENRVFAKYGMHVLRKTPRKGLVRLLEKLKIQQKYLTEDDIAFMVTPRINAASRMGTPFDAFRLLSAKTDDEAGEFSEKLEAVNQERKGIVSTLVKEIKKTVRDRHGESIPSVIALGNPLWRPSLLGLAANSCAEEFGRPVFLWGRDGGNMIKGSCRSEGKSNVVEIMRAVPSGIFTQYGGHKFSGGFALDNEQIHFFEKHLNDAVVKIQDLNEVAVEQGHPDPHLQKYVDMELGIDDISWNLCEEIEKLSPFGMGNPKPLFIFKKITPDGVKTFGKGNEHVELSFKSKQGRKIPAISFFGANSDWGKNVRLDGPIDLVASVEKSMFRGRPEIRLRVVDVKQNI